MDEALYDLASAVVSLCGRFTDPDYVILNGREYMPPLSRRAGKCVEEVVEVLRKYAGDEDELREFINYVKHAVREDRKLRHIPYRVRRRTVTVY